MSISSVVDDFLSKGIECSINRFEKNSKLFRKEKSNLLTKVCIAKAQIFTVRGENIMVVTDENTIISNIKFREYFKVKPRELSNNEIIKITGHPSGGLSPFGLKNPLKIYIDISLKGKNNIYLCAGMKNFVVTVNYNEIIELTCGQWVDICEYNDYVRGVII
ncbi:prolyl-tRNA synthetase [Clostridium carboxidivorans P7]|uniref:YbaK/prolyl-tRNA synthetase n=1 Tax=Clostridium carboxidivorans P7 TaxID=536227 RepID=C6PTL6_9CLOT|nr:YbaK/EbsC family protein [Clostridium carboxidivorans]AKN31768.1 prolyl-tRNA synthetase [Clostridium carboxidivorans P7]EET87446.1 YbaK/prolyl-tRNA synthetase [Clostridium carboxidivorans P7]EFG87404.1 YbaK/prolyl-tRNA synthetase-associated domain protein [Clostridium carboxidivorans P7]